MKETSIEAYECIKPKITKLHTKIIDCLHTFGPLTASELMDKTGVIYNTTWRRLSELKELDLVVNTDDRRKNSRGRSETVVALV